MSLLRDCMIDVVLGAQAAGTTDTLSSDIIDTAGYDCITFIYHLGDVTSGAVLTFNLQQDDVNSAGGMADIAGAVSGTAGASDYDNKLIVMEVYRPAKRYMRAQIDRATQNAVINGITVIRSQGRNKPVTQGSDVVLSDFRASPSEV
jgi:hypothetical protein